MSTVIYPLYAYILGKQLFPFVRCRYYPVEILIIYQVNRSQGTRSLSKTRHSASLCYYTSTLYIHTRVCTYTVWSNKFKKDNTSICN